MCQKSFDGVFLFGIKKYQFLNIDYNSITTKIKIFSFQNNFKFKIEKEIEREKEEDSKRV